MGKILPPNIGDFCFPELHTYPHPDYQPNDFFVFCLTSMDNRRLFGYSHRFTLFSNRPPECITFMSYHYYPETMKDLINLLMSSLNHSSTYREAPVLSSALLEQLFTPILSAIRSPKPTPVPGKPFSIMLPSLDPRVKTPLEFTLTRPDETYGFSSQIDLTNLFQFFSPSKIISLHLHMLREKKIIIVGSSLSQVTDICISLVTLFLPFEWAHIFIPNLPTNMADYLSTPVPFLMGCLKESVAGYEELMLGALIADADKGELYFPKDEEASDILTDGSVYARIKHVDRPFKVPEHLVTLKKPVLSYYKHYQSTVSLHRSLHSDYIQIKQKRLNPWVFSVKVITRFLYFHCHIFRQLHDEGVIQNGEINYDAFVKAGEKDLKPFLVEFTKTSICQEFFERYQWVIYERRRKDLKEMGPFQRGSLSQFLTKGNSEPALVSTHPPKVQQPRPKPTSNVMNRKSSIWEKIAVFETQPVIEESRERKSPSDQQHTSLRVSSLVSERNRITSPVPSPPHSSRSYTLPTSTPALSPLSSTNPLSASSHTPTSNQRTSTLASRFEQGSARSTLVTDCQKETTRPIESTKKEETLTREAPVRTNETPKSPNTDGWQSIRPSDLIKRNKLGANWMQRDDDNPVNSPPGSPRTSIGVTSLNNSQGSSLSRDASPFSSPSSPALSSSRTTLPTSPLASSSPLQNSNRTNSLPNSNSAPTLPVSISTHSSTQPSTRNSSALSSSAIAAVEDEPQPSKSTSPVENPSPNPRAPETSAEPKEENPLVRVSGGAQTERKEPTLPRRKPPPPPQRPAPVEKKEEKEEKSQTPTSNLPTSDEYAKEPGKEQQSERIQIDVEPEREREQPRVLIQDSHRAVIDIATQELIRINNPKDMKNDTILEGILMKVLQ
ncbi:hypothetical protein BLNAU_18768 [Blattamonas nauphoetae]|uniref:UDENN domain-containing protein n=1 Tax=Blattamonas nauphoetae TaxID=2049346 RepID=A0ABQ9X402_9EUKA|nr:hypothetical protein BLNAU_18768 [Blattamonas nauphoetae]